MKKHLLLLLAGVLCAVILLLPGCGNRSAKSAESKDPAAHSSSPASSQSAESAKSAKSPASGGTGSSSEDLNGNAQEIEKMLQGIQNDSARISISQGGDSTVDSLASQINDYLSDSNDQIDSLNK